MEYVEKSELMAEFDKLSIADKRREYGREFVEMYSMVLSLLGNVGVDIKKVKDADNFNNLLESNTDESEYLTGIFEDLLNFKELLYNYINILADEFYE